MLFSRREKDVFRSSIKGILGTKPGNIHLYRLSMRHASTSDDSNERLEFLGDAILGAVIADYLFKKYPYKKEGFLTEIRSRIVKRDTLNGIAQQIGLDKMVKSSNKNLHIRNSSVFGNALEAYIGAVYLDKGFKFTYRYIIETLIIPYIDLKQIIKNNTNYKSLIIEWAQSKSKQVEFKIINENGEQHAKEFTAQIFIDDEGQDKATAVNKKRAEQAAAKKYLLKIGEID